MARLLPILLVLAGAFAVSPPIRAAESPAMGPLSDALLLGRDGAWEGAADGETYRLANAQDANAVKHLAVDPRPGGWRGGMAVEVRLEDAEQAVGGLLYGLQAEPLSYLALVVESAGAVALYTRSPSGLERSPPSTRPGSMPTASTSCASRKARASSTSSSTARASAPSAPTWPGPARSASLPAAAARSCSATSC